MEDAPDTRPRRAGRDSDSDSDTDLEERLERAREEVIRLEAARAVRHGSRGGIGGGERDGDLIRGVRAAIKQELRGRRRSPDSPPRRRRSPDSPPRRRRRHDDWSPGGRVCGDRPCPPRRYRPCWDDGCDRGDGGGGWDRWGRWDLGCSPLPACDGPACAPGDSVVTAALRAVRGGWPRCGDRRPASQVVVNQSCPPPCAAPPAPGGGDPPL